MRATSKSGYGRGWHKQSMRHSLARKTGTAGGRYASLTYNQLKREGVYLKPTGDSDKDGVPNSLDCRPLNPKAQDDGKPGLFKRLTTKYKRFKKRQEHERDGKPGLFKRLTTKYKRFKKRQEHERELEEAKQEQATLKEIEKLKLDIEKEKLLREKERQHDLLKSDVMKAKKELQELRDPGREARIKARNKLLAKLGKKAKKEFKKELKYIFTGK